MLRTFIVLWTVVSCVIAYRTIPVRVVRNNHFLRMSNSMEPIISKNFKAFITTAAALSIFTTFPTASFADESKDNKKVFEACYSKCMFEETRPPPVGASTDRIENTKPRTEILRECRVKCAKTKDQLLLGKPKDKGAATTSAKSEE